MSEAADRHRKALVERVLTGPAQASLELRRAAFDNQGAAEPVRTLIDTIAKHAYQITDEDVAAVKAAGVSEDEIFELTICAALGQATRQLDAALAALAETVEHAEKGA